MAKNEKLLKQVSIDELEQILSIGDEVELIIIEKNAITRYVYFVGRNRNGLIDVKKLQKMYIEKATKEYQQKRDSDTGASLDTISFSRRDIKLLCAN